jgi:hypothetical protein
VIIRSERGRLRLITQHDHGVAAAELTDAWGGDEFHPPEAKAALRLATLVHDQGWQEWDAQPRLQPETGRPYNFINMPIDEHLAIYERCIRLAAEQHPYAGLLVSLHGAGLYRNRYGHMPHLADKPVPEADRARVDAFLAAQEALQREWLHDLHPDPQVLWTHYRWLQCWDALSVFVSLTCGSDRAGFVVGPVPRWPGGLEADLKITGAGGSTFSVAPWPFAPRQVDLFLPVRYLPDRAYVSDAEFAEEYAAAPTQSLHVTLVPGA